MAMSQVSANNNIAVTTGQQLLPTSRLNLGGLLHRVQVSAQGAGTGIISVYDSAQTNGAPSGTLLETISVPTTWTDRYDWAGSLPFSKGLYVVVSGTGAIGSVSWE